MLVNSKKMLEEAKIGHYAVPAANIVNLENIKGVIEAAEETKHPLMVCLAEVHTPTLGIEEAAAIVKYYAEKSNQDIALHYDHGFTIELVKKAIDVGFTSVMIDGSSLPFEENVAKTKEIVAYAHERNVTVEAEIGHVGEGDSYHVEGNTMLTTPEEAKKFVEQTGVDSLAVSIGTAHGEYKGIPHLNFERLQEIATEVSIGIAKVNICTDLLNAARDNTKDGYAERSYYDSVTLAKDGFKDCLKHYYEVFHTK